jgi:hypothetical protein
LIHVELGTQLSLLGYHLDLHRVHQNLPKLTITILNSVKGNYPFGAKEKLENYALTYKGT